MMRKTLCACFALALATLPATAQQRDFSQVQVTATPVAGKIHMLVGAGGNIGVSVGSDGILIVDDQFAPMAEKIRAALKGLGDGKLKFVLNTHWHGDHTGGNPIFGKEATIVAHDNVRQRLGKGQKLRGQEVPAAPAEALPVITFDESLSVHFNGEEIKVIHFPHGHTDGDSVIFFTGSNVVHMGDTFFVNAFPFVDLESGGSVQGLIENIAKVIGQVPADVKIIPGHGPLSTLNDLKTYHRMLTETAGMVRKKIDDGKSLDEIKSEGVPAEWKEWGNGFIKTDVWLESIHTSLTSPRSHTHTHRDGTHH